jgi:transposase-like protein
MLFVTSAVILARDYLGEITASFILVLSVIYALREVFKDDLRDIMWRWIQRGKPKWRRRYIDATTKKDVGRKIEWLDYTTFEKMPDRIKSIRKKRVVQREEEILHYRALTDMATSKFTSGYDQTREILNINFRALTRLMDKSNNRFYKLQDGQVVKESLEKRHLLNLIVKEHNHGNEPVYYRWKIVLSRSKIVDIEQIPL